MKATGEHGKNDHEAERCESVYLSLGWRVGIDPNHQDDKSHGCQNDQVFHYCQIRVDLQERSRLPRPTNDTHEAGSYVHRNNGDHGSCRKLGDLPVCLCPSAHREGSGDLLPNFTAKDHSGWGLSKLRRSLISCVIGTLSVSSPARAATAGRSYNPQSRTGYPRAASNALPASTVPPLSCADLSS